MGNLGAGRQVVTEGEGCINYSKNFLKSHKGSYFKLT